MKQCPINVCPSPIFHLTPNLESATDNSIDNQKSNIHERKKTSLQFDFKCNLSNLSNSNLCLAIGGKFNSFILGVRILVRITFTSHFRYNFVEMSVYSTKKWYHCDICRQDFNILLFMYFIINKTNLEAASQLGIRCSLQIQYPFCKDWLIRQASSL